ncbi:SGNH hydrolase-type esterase domain-containing protein [Pseudomassariella vexata]|uniref:SGNH hydrolase-type esterase domain-containing protein n=1 Tax=Pseudomassariella vexata TaxID=1141098 RepID=A0A1Y2DQJ4_9PEZI|nr:SGNH hydrolase-type esterase domain-containing protein [Pseudomassariella vexata]ORY61568.1 SGNH hydrolase-type esterase domain-containing protein [Pseudomassariella vexata]
MSLILLFLIAAFLQSGTVDVNDQWNRLRYSESKPTGPIAGGIPLRVMFIGASVTLGDHSTGNRGYRKQIRDWMVSLGNPVNCVGANRFGEFKDNDVQAFGAQPIKPTLDRAREIVPQMQPNLILINAGSSDCFQQDHWGAGHTLEYMRNLVDFLLKESPRAAIIMSTIVTCPWEGTEQCVKGANAQIRQVATDLIREEKPVTLAEMHYDQGLPDRPNRTHIGPDGMHPTDEGYFMMGRIFMEKIREVEKNGWLHPPVENGIGEDGDAERDAQEAPKKAGQAGQAGKAGKAEKANTEKPVEIADGGEHKHIRRSHGVSRPAKRKH